MLSQLSTRSKLAIVLAGYAAACIASYVAAFAYNARLAAEPYDTSGGMYAGGEMLTALGAFAVVAVAPSVLALWFLREQLRVWNAVALACLGYAALGLVAVLTPLIARGPPSRIGFVLWELLGLSQLLGVPLWAASFTLFALFAPAGRSRRWLIIAVAIELVIGVAAAVHWFMPRPPL